MMRHLYYTFSARGSKSNGVVERAIQTWKGKMRTMRLHLEDRLKTQTNANNPLLSGLAVWACEVVNKYIRYVMVGLLMNQWQEHQEHQDLEHQERPRLNIVRGILCR